MPSFSTVGLVELTLEAQRAITQVGNAMTADLPFMAARPVQESFPAYVAHELRTPLATQRALLKAIADAHRATVTARPRADGGLTIDVAFPALDQEEPRSCVAAVR